MCNPFVMLPKNFDKWEWYSDIPVKVLWIHFLTKVNYKDIEWRGITIHANQLVTSHEKLKESGLSVQQTRTAIDKLERTNYITKVSTNGYSIITLCESSIYHSYEVVEQQTNQQTNQQAEQQTDNKPDNKRATTDIDIYNNKYINISPPPPRACVGEEVFFAKLKQGFTVWQAQACKILGVDQATLAKYIDMFELECQGKEKKHDDLKDTKEHFIKWARYYMDFEKKRQKESNNETVRTIGINQRRGFEVTATSAEDFKKKVSSRNDSTAGV